MAINCKMRGGPMDGKLYADQHGSERIEVQAPGETKINYWDASNNPFEPMALKRGHYSRSNNVLKNGTVIYIWMGWRE